MKDSLIKICNQFVQRGTKYFVHTNLMNNSFILSELEKQGVKCIECNDARSAAYVATGISAESKSSVILFGGCDAESRNCVPGLTEAFYRNLPIIFITVSEIGKVDYSVEIKDTVLVSKQVKVKNEVEDYNDFENIFDCVFQKSMPAHIDVIINQNVCLDNKNEDNYTKLIDLIKRNNLEKNLINDIEKKSEISNLKYGVFSMTMGAALSNKSKKYVSIISENELMLDLNSLGNRLVPSNILCFVFAKNKLKLIEDYAKSLQFNTRIVNFENSKIDTLLKEYITQENKRPLMVMLECDL